MTQASEPVYRTDDADRVTIYFDGSCPFCTAEIDHYKRADRNEKLELIDVSSDAFAGDDQITCAQALARFHVRLADGQQLSGARGFVEVWRALPSWRWLSRLGSIPGALPLMELGYRGFLKARPMMVRLFLHFQTFSKR